MSDSHGSKRKPLTICNQNSPNARSKIYIVLAWEMELVSISHMTHLIAWTVRVPSQTLLLPRDFVLDIANLKVYFITQMLYWSGCTTLKDDIFFNVSRSRLFSRKRIIASLNFHVLYRKKWHQWKVETIQTVICSRLSLLCVLYCPAVLFIVMSHLLLSASSKVRFSCGSSTRELPSSHFLMYCYRNGFSNNVMCRNSDYSTALQSYKLGDGVLPTYTTPFKMWVPGPVPNIPGKLLISVGGGDHNQAYIAAREMTYYRTASHISGHPVIQGQHTVF